MFLITHSIGSTDNQHEGSAACAEHLADWIITMFEVYGTSLVVHSIRQV